MKLNFFFSSIEKAKTRQKKPQKGNFCIETYPAVFSAASLKFQQFRRHICNLQHHPLALLSWSYRESKEKSSFQVEQRKTNKGSKSHPEMKRLFITAPQWPFCSQEENTESTVFVVVVSFPFLFFFPGSTNTTNIVSISTTEPQKHSPKQQVHFSSVLNSVQLWTQKTSAEPQTRSLSAAWHTLTNSVGIVHMVEKFISAFYVTKTILQTMYKLLIDFFILTYSSSAQL